MKQKMFGHLRLLNIACAAKAKLRVVTLTKPSREAPLAFSLLGGSEKGFRIFIENVEPGSKAAEAGLKRGDQVLLIISCIGMVRYSYRGCKTISDLLTFTYFMKEYAVMSYKIEICQINPLFQMYQPALMA